MSASFRESNARSGRANLSIATLPVVAASVVGVIFLLASLIGPSWLYVPASEVAKTPALTLSFGDLRDLTSSGVVPTNWVQENYFAWLGWATVLLTAGVAATFALTSRRSVASAVGVISVVGLVLTLLAVKGTLTWSAFFDQIPNIRVGGYLVVIGFIVTLGVGILGAAKAQR